MHTIDDPAIEIYPCVSHDVSGPGEVQQPESGLLEAT